MIENTRNTKPEISDKTRKNYYVLMDDSNIVGVCTTEYCAWGCADSYAKEKNAKKSGIEHVYVYEDEFGSHSITIKKSKRLKLASR